MAYSPRTSGGRPSSRLGGRSGYSAPRGGGGNNAAPAIIAGVAIVLLLVVAFLVLGKKDKPAAAPVEPIPVTQAPTPAAVKKEPVLGPRPNLPADIVTRAKALMPRVRTASEEGKRLANEAFAAKDANDQDKWQALLEEARDVLNEAHDGWNEIENEVIDFLAQHPSQGWDDNMLIDAFLKSESSEVQRLIDEPLSRIKKQSRPN